MTLILDQTGLIKGAQPLYTMNPFVAGDDPHGLPRQERLQQIVADANAKGAVLGIDIETYDTDALQLANLPKIIDAVRALNPLHGFGFYGCLCPWIKSLPMSPIEFARYCQRLVPFYPLAAKVDYLFPSLYTSGLPADMWLSVGVRTSMKINRLLASHGHAKVVPFVRPRHGGGKPLTPAYEFLGVLQSVLRVADGAAVWDDTPPEDGEWARAAEAALAE